MAVGMGPPAAETETAPASERNEAHQVSRLGNALGNLLSVPAVNSLLAPLARDRAVILRLHRFSDPELGIVDRDPAGLRRVLEFLRGERYELIPLDELLNRLAGDGPPLRRVVAVTMDDGYIDQATVGAPLFSEFDCPVTTFIATGFLDQQLWFWWDKILYIFRHTRRGRLDPTLGSNAIRYRLTHDGARDRACKDFTERCKTVSDAEKHAAIQRLAAEAEVELPKRAPPEFSPMSWRQLRACEERGMTFAPHTVTHPDTGSDTCGTVAARDRGHKGRQVFGRGSDGARLQRLGLVPSGARRPLQAAPLRQRRQPFTRYAIREWRRALQAAGPARAVGSERFRPGIGGA